MNILLLGITGQVGHELARSLAPLGAIHAPVRQQLDLMDLDAVDCYIAAVAPDLIVNAAAWTAVDAAETERDAAYCLNAELPARLAQYAADFDVPLVHYSTDYVYSGDGAEPWTEDSPTGPRSVYGASKLAGDEAIQASGVTHCIFRTSWVYSARGHNFLHTMLRLGRERTQLQVVDDEIGVPTPARLIADITALSVHAWRLGHDQPNGVMHLAPRGETSWNGFARHVFVRAREAGTPMTIEPNNVAGIASADYPRAAERPRNSRLAVSRLEQALGVRMPDWQQGVDTTMADIL